MNLALVRWLLGQSAVFSGQTWIIKGQGAPGLGLHSDSHGIPPGAGQIAHMCNASWVCTDYGGQEDGPTLFVPGSHHYGRATLPHEADLSNTPFKFMPLIAKAGSLAIWNGATWHASAGRTNPGLRVTLVQNYMRSYMRVQHNYESTSPQLLQKYPELERVIGKALYPYEDPQAPDYSRVGVDDAHGDGSVRLREQSKLAKVLATPEEAYFEFFRADSAKDAEAWAAVMSYPHVRVSATGRSPYYETPEDYAARASWTAREATGWVRSRGSSRGGCTSLRTRCIWRAGGLGSTPKMSRSCATA